MPNLDTFCRNSTLHRSFTVAWVLWLLALTAASIPPIEYEHYSHTSGIAHYATHLTVFNIAGALSVIAFRRRFPPAAILVFVLAVWLEWMQARKYGSLFEMWDVLTNVLGVASGAVVAWWRLRTARAEH